MVFPGAFLPNLAKVLGTPILHYAATFLAAYLWPFALFKFDNVYLRDLFLSRWAISSVWILCRASYASIEARFERDIPTVKSFQNCFSLSFSVPN